MADVIQISRIKMPVRCFVTRNRACRGYNMAMNRSHEMADKVNTLDVKHVTGHQWTLRSVGRLVVRGIWSVECRARNNNIQSGWVLRGIKCCHGCGRDEKDVASSGTVADAVTVVDADAIWVEREREVRLKRKRKVNNNLKIGVKRVYISHCHMNVTDDQCSMSSKFGQSVLEAFSSSSCEGRSTKTRRTTRPLSKWTLSLSLSLFLSWHTAALGHLGHRKVDKSMLE